MTMLKFDNVLFELGKKLPRFTPGCRSTTKQALAISRLNLNNRLAVLDVPCGKGMNAFELATLIPNGDIIACDTQASFIQELTLRNKRAGYHRIHPVVSDLKNLPFAGEILDLIWSETPVQGTAFTESLLNWKKYLNRNGVIIASRLSWITDSRPSELTGFWLSEYPETTTVSGNIELIEKAGFSPLGHIVLPRHAWTDNYYDPFLEQSGTYLEQNKGNQDAVNFVKHVLREINTYHRYNSYYSNVYYIMKKN